ncbi:PRMT5-domain-containing protein [Neoconidiobolus thromboides FSU 785]|nr:PRMT5-domain-containing protein [Neoconidiobolus thromboides FSU 785]
MQEPAPQQQVNAIGLYYTGPKTDLSYLSYSTQHNGYDYLMLDMHSQVKYPNLSEIHYLDIDSLNLVDANYSSYVITKGIELKNELRDEDRINILLKEIEWAIHIGIRAFYLPSFDKSMSKESAILLAKVVKNLFFLFESRIKFILPIYYNPDYELWLNYQLFKQTLGEGKDLYIALILPDLYDPNVVIDLEYYHGELIECIILPKTRFLKNKNGYPVLSKLDQKELKEIIKFNTKFMIRSEEMLEINDDTTCHYFDYIKHLIKQVKKVQFKIEDGNEQYTFDTFASGYYDYLQTPLQPLMDHLESATYEVFEKDPIKYQLYEEAVYHALLDRNSKNKPIVIIVAGAGRGPLVDRCLKASEKSNLPIQLYALEKNPNAYITLQNRKRLEWGDKVDIYFGDMRVSNLPQKADILVTELLGSFGDNELSPECIDGAQNLLNETGISIPYSYTSYLAPVTNTKLYNDTTKFNDPKKFEVPYVVLFQKIRHLTKPIKVWTFEHPNHKLEDKNKHNQREEALEFHLEKPGVVHGFAGYFEAKLYKDILCSIHPDTHSPDMFSWFPIYFPLRKPLLISDVNRSLEMKIWRRSHRNYVWYEWLVTNNSDSYIHNFNGEAYSIGL